MQSIVRMRRQWTLMNGQNPDVSAPKRVSSSLSEASVGEPTEAAMAEARRSALRQSVLWGREDLATWVLDQYPVVSSFQTVLSQQKQVLEFLLQDALELGKVDFLRWVISMPGTAETLMRSKTLRPCRRALLPPPLLVATAHRRAAVPLFTDAPYPPVLTSGRLQGARARLERPARHGPRAPAAAERGTQNLLSACLGDADGHALHGARRL